MHIYKWLILSVCTIFFLSCEKGPGEGGRASIKGKIYIQEYNSNCTELREEYYGINERVFIIAGNEPSYFEDVRTGPDGTFWFKYLREGKYQVYALSDNCDAPGETETIIIEVNISESKQEFETEDIVVIR